MQFLFCSTNSSRMRGASGRYPHRHHTEQSKSPCITIQPMPNPRFAIVILAAGKGTRLKSKLPKVLHRIAGRPLLGHVVAAAAPVVEPADIFCVIGQDRKSTRLNSSHVKISYA